MLADKYAILGGYGQLGSEFAVQLGERAVTLSRDQADLVEPARLRKKLNALGPIAGVINCAAYTKVDLAEQEPELCRQINVLGVRSLAILCAENDWQLVQLSTDYLFGRQRNQNRPWREDDPISPTSKYSASKAAGEQFAAAAPRHLIIRTCGLYGPPRTPKVVNFVETMLRLGRERLRLRVVNDQVCTPSNVRDVAAATLFLLERNMVGLFHITNSGETNWHDFATEIFRLTGIATPIDPISTAEYGAAAERPAYSVLDCGKYEALATANSGPQLRSWQVALDAYLAERKIVS